MVKGGQRVLLAGDTHGIHGDAVNIVEAANDHDVDLIIQLGDFGYNFKQSFLDVWTKARAPVYFLRGNHDNTDWIDARATTLEADQFVDGPMPVAENVWYLPDGLRVKIGHSVVAVLGGAISIDRANRSENYSWWRREPTSMAAAAELINTRLSPWGPVPCRPVDVLLCHDVPACPPSIEALLAGYKDDPASAANRALLRNVFDAIRPTSVYHGHYHVNYTETYAGATFHGLAMRGPDAWTIAEF